MAGNIPIKHLPGAESDKQYTLIRRIGRGGFGEVFEGIDEKNGEKVAIKIYRNDTVLTVEDWEREAKQALSVSGKNIIKTFGLHKTKHNDEDLGYLIMEFAEGGSLREIIDDYVNQKEKPFIPTTSLLDLMRQSLLGLKEVHQKLLHRDIKPENFLLVSKVLKVSDFGLAKFIDESTRTKTYKGWGTYRYMPPESWTLGKMTPATDIYSIGVMFYELTTLRPPYLSDNPLELENLHRFGSIPNARNINNDISSGLDGIIRKAMQKDPKDRYQTAEEMLKDIEAIKTDAPSLPGMGDALELASKIYSKEEQVKAQQEEKDRQNAIMTSKCLYKIGEFIDKVQGVLEVFNQNFPQEKVLLSKGTETDYTLIWKGADLIRFRFNPHLFSMKLTIGGNKLSAYGYAEILNGYENEGLNFILVDLDESDSYGSWKILEVTGSPLVPNQPHYSVAVELEVIKRISKLGNVMDIWQHTVRDIEDFNEEIINLIKKSLEYLNNPPKLRRQNGLIEIVEDDDW